MDKKIKEDLQLQRKSNEQERFRMKQLLERDAWMEKTLHDEKIGREQFERVRFREMANRSETDEILRRNEEECRMKTLEERQAAREVKRMSMKSEKENELKDKQLNFKYYRDLTTANIRKGIFKWEKGTLRYYRNARQNEVPWVRYEDETGRPYYYDSISKKSQYHEPNDSYILNATDIAIDEYEAIHGAGSYGIMLADRAWKDEANANGGYYDDRGRWKTLRGYWDPDKDYQWTEMSHGYYNEHGEFVLHPPVVGDLDFMV